MSLKHRQKSASRGFAENHNPFPWRWFAGAFLLGSLITGLVLFKGDSCASGLQLKPEPPPVKLSEDNAALGLEQAFIQVAAVVGPAVVNISSEWTEKVQGLNNLGSMDDFLNFWFYGPGGPMQRRAPEIQQKQKSLGSGFLITSDGYILTNAHVIGKAEKVTVTMQDGRDFRARVVGKDEKTDIGIVKIESSDLPHVALGDSDKIQVGQWSIAIGNPFALDHTVTTGVISAKGRTVSLNESSPYQSYIQTDASINPGNSGGPLCNIRGEVIGINTAIFSQTGGSVGIGFAIPINVAKKVAHDLANEGRVVRAGLGATVQSLDYKMAKSFGLNSSEGALLSAINPGSAAQKGGLKAGDVVLEMDGVAVVSASELVARMYTKVPGEKVSLLVLRSGRKYKLEIVLQALDEVALAKPEKDKAQIPSAVQPREDRLGLAAQNPTAEVMAQLPAGAPKGPVVMNVERGSPAADAGLKLGDIILQVDDHPVQNVAELEKAWKAHNLRQGVRLFVWREGTTLYLYLQTEE